MSSSDEEENIENEKVTNSKSESELQNSPDADSDVDPDADPDADLGVDPDAVSDDDDDDDDDDDSDNVPDDIDDEDLDDVDLDETDSSKKEKEISGLKTKDTSNSKKIQIDNEFNFGADESIYISPPPSDIDDDDDDYLQKFDSELRNKFVNEYHPEVISNNFSEIDALTNKPHKTIPFLTKYEKTRILGLRAKQINQGSKPYVELKNKIIEGYLIAELELRAKKIPFIVRRPLPDNSSEYWKLEDLEII